MKRNKSASSHQFAMIPRPDVPRSAFRMQKNLKTSFDAGYLVPIFLEEVLPGDTWRVRMNAFGRLATPIFPIMDNIHFETFFFFVPNRLVWDNWQRFNGEQIDPGDSTDFLVPIMNWISPTGGLGLSDHFGLPLNYNGPVSCLPYRGYNLIYNEWFRDQNLIDSVPVNRDDGPDDSTLYGMLKRNKRHDYFTSALPFPQKGDAVTLPLTGDAPVVSRSANHGIVSPVGIQFYDAATTNNPSVARLVGHGATGVLQGSTGTFSAQGPALAPANMYADLSQVTSTTINALRQSFQIQKVLERDARGGTRYTEILRAHFGVVSPDARLQRPEYLGGGHTYINIHPVAQTQSSPGTGADWDTPQGNLAAFGTVSMGGHGFTQSFTEHGYIIGIANVRADLTYQQGIRRHWFRRTRFDFYLPAFAHLGEQAVLNKEIYAQGLAADDDVFGYQERWAELRYNPNEIHGLFRSTAANTIDNWHLAQNFTSLPTLNQTFIEENPPLDRILAVGSAAAGQQLLLDCFYDMNVVRPLPLFSVPGLMDHF